MTATAQQMRPFDIDAYAATPPPPFGLGRVLGLAVILVMWALIAGLIWTLA
jgi:hypothetical protein